ncbi:hypothetical protein BDR07DRAFT_804527 [Suillus spraguei]|nr:hypothetical protein BDR07DRAFT_804527 [Suillus spraguei]
MGFYGRPTWFSALTNTQAIEEITKATFSSLFVSDIMRAPETIITARSCRLSRDRANVRLVPKALDFNRTKQRHIIAYCNLAPTTSMHRRLTNDMQAVNWNANISAISDIISAMQNILHSQVTV